MFQLLPIFLAYIMFALGLQTQISDFKQVLVEPKAFIVGLTMQWLLVPSIAYLLVNLFVLPPHLGFGIMLLSICASGVTSNMLSLHAGGRVALSITLTTVASILAIFTIPLWLKLLYPLFLGGLPTDLSVVSLSIKVLIITTLPVLLGIATRHYFTAFVTKWQSYLQHIANILFAVMVVSATVSSWHTMVAQLAEIGILVLLMVALLLITSLTIANVCKLDAADCKTLAIEVSLQNGAMGIALASLLSQSNTLPNFAIPSAIYGVLMNFVILPFVLFNVYQRCRDHSRYNVP